MQDPKGKDPPIRGVSSGPGQTNASREYIAALTGLRGIAAVWVFLFHFPALHPDIRPMLSGTFTGQAIQQSMDMGFAGVYLFFVLSGFLLALPFANAALGQAPRPALSVYFKRRLLRVFPAYYAQFAIILILGTWMVTWRPLAPAELLAHLAMFFNVGPWPVDAMLSVWWTLPVEFSFYLLLPFIAMWMQPRRWLFFLAAGIAFSLLYQAWASNHFAVSVYRSFLAVVQLPGTLPLFLLGASGAILVRWMSLGQREKPSPWLTDLLFVSGAAGSIIWLALAVLPNINAFYLGHWSLFATPLALGGLFTLMVLGLYWGSRAGKLLCANAAVYYTGLVSYSLYLWHFPVMQQVRLLGGGLYSNMSGLTRFIICAVAVIAVSSISYFAFERPFFRLRGERKSVSR